jgi:undecaprenyl-diphosphatase
MAVLTVVAVAADIHSLRRATMGPVVRRVLLLLAALFAIHILLPMVGQGESAWDAVRHGQWGWIVAVVVTSAVTYLAAAVALMGGAGRRLALGRTWAAQVAAAFTNRLAPAGIGGMTTNVRFLDAAGVDRPEAVAAVGLDSLAGFLVHLVSVIAIVPLLGATQAQLRVSGPDLPDNWWQLVIVVAVLVTAGLIRWGAQLRRRAAPPVREALHALATTMRNPRAGAALIGGSMGVTAGYALALVFAARATGVALPMATITAVYLGGAAVAAVAPTPGGLGALEAALVAGLTAAGAASGPAVAAVLVYRLITFWLPILPGFFAYRALRREGAL